MFGVGMSEPPPASSGEVYKTIDERCAACQVWSEIHEDAEPGPEEPCVPKSMRAKIRATTGRPCPRVELLPENVMAATVAALSLSESSRHLVPFVLEASGLSKAEQGEAVTRAIAAMGSRELGEAQRARVKADLDSGK